MNVLPLRRIDYNCNDTRLFFRKMALAASIGEER